MLELPDLLEEFVDDTSESNFKKASYAMKSAFDDHVLKSVGENIWLCGKPSGSSVWHFYVALLPHCIVVYGDIGDLLIRPGWNRGIGWLRGCLENKPEHFGYMLSKVPNRELRTQFMPGDVISECFEYGNNPDNEVASEIQAALDEWAERLGGNEDPRQAWYTAASSADLECEWYAGYNDYTQEVYWCAYALQWFVREWVKQNPDTE